TRREVWRFNPDYLTGASLLGLPLEEWLFFFCIPYACLFTYDAFKVLQPFDFLRNHRSLIGWGLFLFSLCAGLYSYPKLYSTSAFLLLCVFMFLLQTVWKNAQLSRFYWTYALLLVPFFAVNGILTGTLLDEPVVWYNNSENLGFRLGTIPFEDAFYGMLLLFMNFAWFDFFEKRKVKQNVPTRRKERIPVS
ncbi:MAG: lycopene cyclase domain-containing protein, partial [Cytophagales bacterium]|nr:lycopene cyclase domain-containing protein [Cytophagales bacterium]